MKRPTYSKMDMEIDEELYIYIQNVMDKDDMGFIIASDIQRMVFFSDYQKTMDEYKRQQPAFSVEYIEEENRSER